MTKITRLSLPKDALPAVARLDPMNALERAVRRGGGIALIPTPGKSQIVAISDPTLLRQIFQRDETTLSCTDRKGKIYDLLRQRGPDGERGDVLDGGPFSEADSERSSRIRKAARMTHTREVAASILTHFTELLEGEQGKETINLLDLLKKSFIHGLALRLFGAGMQEVGQARLASYAPEYFERMAWQLLFALLPGKKGFGREKYAKTGQALGTVFDEMIDAAIQDRSKFTESLLSQLLDKYDVNDPEDRQSIKGTLGTEVMAGFDSVGVIVAQACRELARNKSLQADLRREGENVARGSSIAPSMWKDLRETRSFWKLSTHKHPAFRVIFRRVSKEHILEVKRKGFTIQHTVRPGDQLLLVLSGAHYDPEYWRPEDMTLGHIRDGWTDREEHAHLPYGLGKRECLGKTLAEMIGPLLIAAILQRCVITLPWPRLPGVAVAMTSPLRSTIFKVKWRKAA